MNYVCDSMIDIKGLNLNYEAHMAGLECEYIEYSVYLENGVSNKKITEIKNAINNWAVPYERNGIFLGYIGVLKKDDKALICLDYGTIDNFEVPVCGILTALNDVSEISSVIINEGSDYHYEVPSVDDFFTVG